MSKRLFIKSLIKNSKDVGAILPSSSFLAKKMLNPKIINKSKVILEIGPGTGVFTKKLFKMCQGQDKKIIVIERDINFYNHLIKNNKLNEGCIYNSCITDVVKILKDNKIDKIDLIISSLPFKSLPENIFDFVIDDLCKTYFDENSYFVQFSYFKNQKKEYEKYFDNINTKKCILNIPSAYVFECTEIKRQSNQS